MKSKPHSYLWLVGASTMAQDYAQVLKSLKFNFIVIGRGEKSALTFESKTGISVITGGLENALQSSPPPKIAIVAVGVTQLKKTTIKLLDAGTKRILLEKPGGINLKEIEEIHIEAQAKKARIFLGYNRRFYESTKHARKIITSDGGATSCHFEFTEWSNKIRKIEGKDDIKSAWLLANSSHVIDLAFHLCGSPKDWQSWKSGTLDWHPTASRFSGAGKTDLGVIFSYFADWESPGRWGVEILTKKNRLILRPMEKLQITYLDSVEIMPVKLNYEIDMKFKPGLFKQTEAFLNEDYENFCTLKEHVEKTKIYTKIAGYQN